MKSRILRIIAIVFILTGVLYAVGGVKLPNSSTAFAVGDLTIDWGVPSGNPIFVITNIMPGDEETRTVDVTNSATTNRPVGVRGVKTSETADLSTVLDFVILENGTDIYGGTSGTGLKTLAEFFSESSGPEGIPLSLLAPGASTTYTFKVTFQEGAGNEFQGASVVFDLKIGIAIAVPEECEGIEFDGDPIFGTQGNNTLNGTNGNDLIFGFEGNDRINSSNGRDCVVAGTGNDIVNNSNGDDVVIGDEGNDRLHGSNGDDRMFGGPGNDVIDGSNGNDFIDGGEGDDRINGGNGNDEIHAGGGNDRVDASNGNDIVFGGSGNDILDGGNGSDTLEGQDGNDTLRGGNNNDTLIGGAGTDSANGNLGTDTCDAESETNCEL